MTDTTTTAAKKPIPTFRFSVGGLCAVEAELGAKIGAIVTEAASSEGLSLRMLRALVAAGLEPRNASLMPVQLWFDVALASAEKVITTYGIEACASGIARPLGERLRDIR